MESFRSKWPLCKGNIDNYKAFSLRTWTAVSRISCSVRNYSDLVNSVYHCLTCTVSDNEIQFKVFKGKKTHFFQLHCHLKEDMCFNIKYDEGEFSVEVPSRTTDYGYWVDVSKEVVYDSRNKHLHEENILFCQFHSAYKTSFTRLPIATNGRRTRRDEELLSRDMQSLYDIRESTGDFFIKLKGEQFKVHKFIFDARTMWFKLNPESLNWKEICIEGEPLVMDKVVRYIYTGVLEEADLGDMLEILKIAETLEMTGLIQTLKSGILSWNMPSLYDIRDSTGDFLIKVKGEQFKVHKFVLEARAKWFKDNPKSLDICIQGEPLIMDKVVRYMYIGVLQEENLGYMLEILKIADTLEMTDLIQTVKSGILSWHMLRLYDIRESTGDFLIKVKGEPFKVHKFVFDARAKFFKLNPKSLNWKALSIQGEPVVMDKVVRYMYSEVLEETDLVDMLEILKIDHTLQMTGLTETLTSGILKMMCKDNAHKVLQTAEKLGMTDLAHHAKEYLPEQRSMCSVKGKKSKNRKKKRH